MDDLETRARRLGIGPEIRQKAVCPWCGEELDVARTVGYGSGGPGPGALAVCLHCGEMSVYDDDRALRKLTAREMLELQLSRDWPPIEHHWRTVRKSVAERSRHPWPRP